MAAIARALMARPRLLLLDEPSLGLAPVIVLELFEIIERVNAEGVAVLLVEQNVAMALDIAARAYVLEQGRIVAEGTPEALLREPRLRRAYLGADATDAADGSATTWPACRIDAPAGPAGLPREPGDESQHRPLFDDPYGEPPSPRRSHPDDVREGGGRAGRRRGARRSASASRSRTSSRNRRRPVSTWSTTAR